MIESCYWKEELLRISKTLKRRTKPTRWTVRQDNVIKREIFVGFALLRKMNELNKLSTRIMNQIVEVNFFDARGKYVTKLNDHNIDELYEIENEKIEKASVKYLTNQFIHSYIFCLERDETQNWSHIFIVSDFDRNKRIWRIPVAIVQTVLEDAGSNYPHTITSKFCTKKNDFVTFSE